jgi:hypothetical protein
MCIRSCAGMIRIARPKSKGGKLYERCAIAAQISVTPERERERERARARARERERERERTVFSLFPSFSLSLSTSPRTWPADKSASELGGARDERAIRPNVCRPSGNSLVPKIALSTIDSRDRYSAAVRWNRRGVPKAARSEIPSRRQGDRKEESSGRSGPGTGTGTGREGESRAALLFFHGATPRVCNYRQVPAREPFDARAPIRAGSPHKRDPHRIPARRSILDQEARGVRAEGLGGEGERGGARETCRRDESARN